MAKIPRQLWHEFFSTESVERKEFIRELIHNRMEYVFHRIFKNATFYFADAEEGEMGTFENYLMKHDTQIDYMYELFCLDIAPGKSFTSFFYVSDIVEVE